MKQITLDYDDTVGGFYMSLMELNLANNPKPFVLETAKRHTKEFFDYIEKWQELGLNLDDIEYLESDSDDQQ